jgi:hypothetical protein
VGKGFIYLWTYGLYGPVRTRNAFDAGKSITKEVGGGWALEIETFLDPMKRHRAVRRVTLGAQKIKIRDFQGSTPQPPPTGPLTQVMDLFAPHQKHYVHLLRIRNHGSVNKNYESGSGRPINYRSGRIRILPGHLRQFRKLQYSPLPILETGPSLLRDQ